MVKDRAIQMQGDVVENQLDAIFVPGWKTGM